MAGSLRRAARRRANTSASASATQPEMVALLEEIRKVDPTASFRGHGRYITLTAAQDWTPEQMKKIEAIFEIAAWKVKYDLQ
jgi:hypothetical protein